MEIEKKDIVTINLKYGSSVKPLKVLAFAQLSAKALFLSKVPMTIDAIATEIARLIGVKKISVDLIKNGLEYLVEINKVKQKDNNWFLYDDARKEIIRDIDSARYQIRKVIEKHFPNTVEIKKLKAWFTDASASFFGYYGDEWVGAISKKANKQMLLKGKTIDELLLPSIKEHHFDAIQQSLLEGFIRFLSSDDNIDQQYLMLISQAMFSARLVAADIGVDPITLQELKDSTFILDTNVLLSTALEAGKQAKSINSLEDALKALNSNLVYLYVTKEEYGRALVGKRGEILHLVDTFPDEIIKDVADDFVATAKSRGCVSREDYERFFTSLVSIPTALTNGYKIAQEDDGTIVSIAKNAEKDKDQKKEIQKCAEKVRPKWRGPKSEMALNHDAGLLCVAKFIRSENKKCWILSLDRSLQMCAINQAGPHGMPMVLSVSALIEILSVNNAGPELDSTNFAPLLAKIILNECMPPSNTYIIQDLTLLHKINEKAAELSPEDIRGIVKEITKARIEGKVLGSTNLELKVNRLYQENVMSMTTRLMEAKEKTRVAEESANEEKKKREEAEKNIIKIKNEELKRNALNRFVIQLVLRLFTSLLLSYVIFICFWLFFDRKNEKEVIRYVLSVVTLLLTTWKSIPQAFRDYKKSCNEAEQN